MNVRYNLPLRGPNNSNNLIWVSLFRMQEFIQSQSRHSETSIMCGYIHSKVGFR